MLQSVAATYDHASSSSPHRGTRLLTNIHEVSDGLTEYEYEHDPILNDGDIDDSYFGSFLEANSSNFRKRPSLPKEVWQKLSRADQLFWGQISDTGKWILILGLKTFSSNKKLPTSTMPIDSLKPSTSSTHQP